MITVTKPTKKQLAENAKKMKAATEKHKEKSQKNEQTN
jgi:hypothetical protein